MFTKLMALTNKPDLNNPSTSSLYRALWDDEHISKGMLAIDALCNLAAIESELAKWNSEALVLTELTRKYIEENASSTLSQDAYQARYNDLLTKYNAASTKIAELNEAKEHRRSQQTLLTAFIATIEKSEKAYETFDEELWKIIVQKATVYSDGRTVFIFSNGQEIEGEQRPRADGIIPNV